MTTPRDYYLNDKPVETVDFDDHDFQYDKWPRAELDRRTLAAQTDFSEVGGVKPDPHYKAPDPLARHDSDEWFDIELDHETTGAYKAREAIKAGIKVDYQAIAWTVFWVVVVGAVIGEVGPWLMRWYLGAKVMGQ